MQTRKRLIINLTVILLTALIIFRDRLPSYYFELSISTKNEQSVTVPTHLIHCNFSHNLYCKVPIGYQALVIEETGTLDCRAKFDKQTPKCYWLQASALESISIEGLELTPIQLLLIKHSIKPFPTARIFDDPAVNMPFLLLFLGVLSVLSGFNVAESVFLYAQRFYHRRDRQMKTTISVLCAAIAGFGVISFLALGFMLLLWFFGYVD